MEILSLIPLIYELPRVFITAQRYNSDACN